MCWVCIPTCGNCQPPRKRMVPCPECGGFTLVDLQVTSQPKAWACMTCGADITAGSIPQPRHCDRFGVECANPCGKSNTPFQVGEAVSCQFHTPLLELSLS